MLLSTVRGRRCNLESMLKNRRFRDSSSFVSIAGIARIFCEAIEIGSLRESGIFNAMSYYARTRAFYASRWAVNVNWGMASTGFIGHQSQLLISSVVGDLNLNIKPTNGLL